MRLFDRQARLTIVRMSPGQFFEGTDDNAIEIDRLRITFDVRKDLDPEPNTCTIEVYNLSEETRTQLQNKPLQVRLDAGYEGNIARLFTGDLRWVQHVREGTEIKTTIELGDGARAFRHARVNRSFKPGTSALQVVKEAASSMGLGVPKDVAGAKALAKQFVSGASLQGPSSREMSRALRAVGYGWSIQNGKLQILEDGTATTATAELISQTTGMIGSPEFGAPPEPGKPPELRVRQLLNPRIEAGRRVQVTGEDVDGLFRVVSLNHRGDTHGAHWETEVEGR